MSDFFWMLAVQVKAGDSYACKTFATKEAAEVELAKLVMRGHVMYDVILGSMTYNKQYDAYFYRLTLDLRDRHKNHAAMIISRSQLKAIKNYKWPFDDL